MTRKDITSSLLLLLTAAIWGFAFVAQKVGGAYVGSFTFNGIRFLIGSASLIPVILLLDRSRAKSEGEKSLSAADAAALRKKTLAIGIGAGLILCIAANLQQVGISGIAGLPGTTAGKAGFITALYVVLVPVCGIFMRQRVGKNVWLGMVLAITGIYLLSVTEGFSIAFGDLIVLIGAFFWTAHILYIDKFVHDADPVKISALQFATAGVISLVIAVCTEPIVWEGILSAAPAILYGGVFSTGVAYTLQVVAQRDAKPALAAIILSMESVFSVIGGALLLNEQMTARGYLGCVLVFTALILAQVKFTKAKQVQ